LNPDPAKKLITGSDPDPNLPIISDPTGSGSTKLKEPELSAGAGEVIRFWLQLWLLAPASGQKQESHI
jgi:hypothetical protein